MHLKSLRGSVCKCIHSPHGVQTLQVERNGSLCSRCASRDPALVLLTLLSLVVQYFCTWSRKRWNTSDKNLCVCACEYFPHRLTFEHISSETFACLQQPNIFLFLNNKGRKTSSTSDISLRLWQRWKSNLHLSSGPSESTVTRSKQTKASRNTLYEALQLGTAANFKNTILVSPRETDENKNDIKGSSQFLAQIKGDEFLAALNARLSPGIEIDIN